MRKFVIEITISSKLSEAWLQAIAAAVASDLETYAFEPTKVLNVSVKSADEEDEEREE